MVGDRGSSFLPIYINRLVGVELQGMRENESGWGGLPEVLVAIFILLTVFIANGILMRNSIASQQDINSYNRGVQIARDYIERAKQVDYNSLGWDYTLDLETGQSQVDPTAADSNPPQVPGDRPVLDYHNCDISESSPTSCLPVVDVPQDENWGRLNVFPESSFNVSNTNFFVTSLVYWNSADPLEQSHKIVHVTVQWEREDGYWDNTTLRYIRVPSPAEHLPSHMNPGEIIPLDGRPTAPSFIDENQNNRRAGYSTDLGEGLEFVVKSSGSAPISSWGINLVCTGGRAANIDQNNYSSLGLTVDVTENQDGSKIYRIYYVNSSLVRPSGLNCFSEDFTAGRIFVANSFGQSEILNITPSNILKMRSGA